MRKKAPVQPAACSSQHAEAMQDAETHAQTTYAAWFSLPLPLRSWAANGMSQATQDAAAMASSCRSLKESYTDEM